MTVVRWAVVLLVFLALLFLALQNSELVTVRFYHWFSWEAPLILLLLIAFSLGVGAGLLAGLMRYVRLRRQLGRLRRDHRRGSPEAQSIPIDGAG